ncbi:ESX secretion-associated protein EspG [Mycobacterium sp. M1]|uniref:ESX secretion-associated protein EspG n=1 Tax=Mycolicibacter acidiphilus TaxID=2835306 RepID=A0ABS5RND0_9MYCO|nr:ESX secretion-associated protein EspG [Mycolicibacter acidiphilus]MBS9535807.1 ESX secretion-associated protein EspG [Mycolicibacter acidiphilus]
MGNEPNAVELTVEQAWYIAETVGAGSFPWVLAITMPYTDAAEREPFLARQRDELTAMGVVSADGVINPAVAEWIRVVCFCDRWLDLRYVGPAAVEQTAGPEMLRGIVARRGGGTGAKPARTVVALRNAQLVTFTAMDIDDPRLLVPVLGAGLRARPPAKFDEFTLPARVGVRADERLRAGAPLVEVLDYLGIPASARPVVESVFVGPRSYVEVVAGCADNGRHTTTEVGMSIVDTDAGRILISPSRAFDGEWISTFRPGTDFSIAVAIEQLTATLPDGSWFPGQRLSRDFTAQMS